MTATTTTTMTPTTMATNKYHERKSETKIVGRGWCGVREKEKIVKSMCISVPCKMFNWYFHAAILTCCLFLVLVVVAVIHTFLFPPFAKYERALDVRLCFCVYILWIVCIAGSVSTSKKTRQAVVKRTILIRRWLRHHHNDWIAHNDSSISVLNETNVRDITITFQWNMCALKT